MIKGLFKLVFNLIKLAILLIVLALIFHTWTIKHVMQSSLSWSLGANASIESVKMDWKNTGFEIQGLTIENPDGFSSGILADIPLVIISVDISALSRGKLQLKTVGFNLKELYVIHTPTEGINVMNLKPMKKEGDGQEKRRSEEGAKEKIGRHMPGAVIDELILSIGNIKLVESLDGMERQKTLHVGIQGATYYDLEGTSDITYVVVTLALRKLGFNLLNDISKQFEANFSRVSSVNGFLERLKKSFE